MESFWLILFVVCSMLVISSGSPSNPVFPLQRSHKGFNHHTGCKRKLVEINLTHPLCSKPKRLNWFGCTGYCPSKSTAEYTPGFKNIDGIDVRCTCCKATSLRYFATYVCDDPRSETVLPFPMGCVCQPCNHDMYK